jgi:hypothetical protein
LKEYMFSCSSTSVRVPRQLESGKQVGFCQSSTRHSWST